jgi:UDP-3-O-[3-hydroxymyristoyl] N-acetylglucosamine deacetylase
MYFSQKTLAKEIVFNGIGVHSGEASSVTLKPMPVGYGIVFTHHDYPDDYIIMGSVIPESAMHATVIKGKLWSLSTIEHLMAAINFSGIDNLLIEVSGSEVPIFDGSAYIFISEIQEAGVVVQDAQKQFITPKKTLVFSDREKKLEIFPAETDISWILKRDLYFKYVLDFDNEIISRQTFSCKVTEDFFLTDIAPARTFGFLEQLSFLRSHGLARGTSLGNTVVISDGEYLNELRFDNECVRHKVLDLLGDLSLLGRRLVGRIEAYRTGHNFNRLVIEHFINHPDMWEIFT